MNQTIMKEYQQYSIGRIFKIAYMDFSILSPETRSVMISIAKEEMIPAGLNHQIDAVEVSSFDFVRALKIAEGVFEQYKIDQRKWWNRMDGTPILNDIAVRMAEAFRDAISQRN